MMLKKLLTQLKLELVSVNWETEDTEPEEDHLLFMVERTFLSLELLEMFQVLRLSMLADSISFN